MTPLEKPDLELESRVVRKLLDVFIRAGLILALTLLCYQIFSPFIALMAWALILAVTLYPTHQALSHKLKGRHRQGLAATLLVAIGLVLIVLPTAALMYSMGSSTHDLVVSMRSNEVVVPAPPASVAEWPVVGKKIHAIWSEAHSDLSSILKSLQPQIADLAKKALGMVASIAATVLLFVASFIVAGIMMAFGEGGAARIRDIFMRITDVRRGEDFVRLSTATIRSVALGVLGVAAIQAIAVGLVLMVAGVPFAGGIALIVLVLGIAQIPVLPVTLLAIFYIWSGDGYGVAAAVTYSVLLVVAGMLDNVLKPLLLGRGVDAPMPVILIGALGGLASGGILGMFVGATVLALGYQIFMLWVDTDPNTGEVKPRLPTAEEAAQSVKA